MVPENVIFKLLPGSDEGNYNGDKSLPAVLIFANTNIRSRLLIKSEQCIRPVLF